jgi:hypothetical protein
LPEPWCFTASASSIESTVSETKPETAVRRRIRADHADVVDRVAECSAAVAAAWDGDATADRAALVDPLERRLRETGVLADLPAVLIDAVDAAGGELAATPVAAPPYVVVTSTGPLLRATVDAGRLVVAFRTFAVERGGDGGGVRYVHRGVAPAETLAVSLEGRSD